MEFWSTKDSADADLSEFQDRAGINFHGSYNLIEIHVFFRSVSLINTAGPQNDAGIPAMANLLASEP